LKKVSFFSYFKANSYQNFPSSDTLTRRLKKVIQTIIKNEEDKGEIDFDESASSENESKGWSSSEKQQLLKFITNYGIPINNEGR
jgi:hypothetical protein